jgi:hypothetical protein
MSAFIMTRREALGLLAAAGASSVFGASMSPMQKLTPAVDAVDHLLLGTSDLDKGIALIEKLTGVKAVIGGSHPGVGTRNALLALGGKRYLEIIGPDPAQTTFTSRQDVRKLAEPRLITWAAATNDIAALAKQLTDKSTQVFGPRDGSRARPDGKVLKWKSMATMHESGAELIDPVPFIIEWAADSVHPSQDSPSGCTLQSLEFEAPKASAVLEDLRLLGIDASVKEAKAPRLIATLKTPKGTVTLT